MSSSGGILTRKSGATIAYRQSKRQGKITGPGVVFIHGLRSDMNGGKALAIEAHCRESGRAFLCFDLSGHGRSSGRFEEGCIGDWKEDVLEAVDALTSGPQIIVGSSLGGWLMLLAARERPERIAGLLGLAAAPDFTEDLMISAFDADQRRQLESEGQVMIDDCYGEAPYAITRRLIVEGRNHLLLRGPIAIDCPVALIQGQQDPDVPWQTALTLAEKLRSPRVEVTIVKSAGHRLSEPENLRLILAMLDRLIEG
jgi:pimeloyl-ACP methyl ester carboxylesterase